MGNPSDIEIKNAQDIVLPMLMKIEDISVNQTREDIFVVTEHSTKYKFSIIVDVEPSTVCLILEVVDLPNDDNVAEMMRFMLEQNNVSVHGKFCIGDNKVFIRENLEIENLDQNELESAISHMFFMVSKNFRDLLSFSSMINDEDEGDDGDDDFMDDDSIVDIEDLAIGAAMYAANSFNHDEGPMLTSEESSPGACSDSIPLTQAMHTEEEPDPLTSACENEDTTSSFSSGSSGIESSDSFDSGSSDCGGGFDD